MCAFVYTHAHIHPFSGVILVQLVHGPSPVKLEDFDILQVASPPSSHPPPPHADEEGESDCSAASSSSPSSSSSLCGSNDSFTTPVGGVLAATFGSATDNGAWTPALSIPTETASAAGVAARLDPGVTTPVCKIRIYEIQERSV